MALLKPLNLGLMFLLELAVYAGAATWGLSLDVARPVATVAGVAAASALAVVWAIFGSPRARVPLRGGARVALEILWFGSGAVAWAAAGWPEAAIVLAALALLNGALRAAWRQRAPARPG